MKTALMTAAAFTLVAASAQAATYVYDFKAEANVAGGGAIGEAIFDVFNTDDVYTGPNLKVTATKDGDDAYVYFDNGNAGMGVCEAPTSMSVVNALNPGSGGNRCLDPSDDGLTTVGETLHFTATESAVRITSIFINSNHDAGSIFDTSWDIGGTIYDSDDFVGVDGGDIRIDLDIALGVSDSFLLSGVEGPNSYISAIAVSQVPLPAAGLLMLAGLGGLSVLRGRRKS